MVLAAPTCRLSTSLDNLVVVRPGQCDMKQHRTMTEHSDRPRSSQWNSTSLPPDARDCSIIDLTKETAVHHIEDRRIVNLDDPDENDDDDDDDDDDDTIVKREPSTDVSSPQNVALLARLQSRRDRRSNSVKRKTRNAQPHIRLLSVLQRGSADPFNAAGITITPQVNQILAFARDICLPAFYFQDSLRDSSISAQSSRDVTNSSGWISSPAARRGWQQVVDALDDKCTALACLSTYLALMAACDINATKATEASLKMRAGSSALLRQRLFRHNSANTTTESHRELLWQVFWHFYAEFFAGNMEAAQIHGKMLRQSCEAAEEGIITSHFLDSVLFVDSHMSAKYMTRTVLDVDEWIPNVFADIWDKIDPNVADITKEDGEGLHHTISSEPLRSILVRTRQSLILLRPGSESHAAEIDYDTLYLWLNSHTYADGGKVVDLYLLLVDRALHAPLPKQDCSMSASTGSRGTETSGSLYTQACLCLCALYSIRDIGQEININGIDIVDASSTISKHLRESLMQALTNCTPGERKKYRPTHLWCAYIGALAEQRFADPSSRHTSTAGETTKAQSQAGLRRTITLPEKPTSSRSTASMTEPCNMPFNQMLAELAHNMALLSWQQVSDVLKQFIYTDTAEPHGSRWFWKTMGAYLDRRRRFQAQQQQQQQQRQQQSETNLPERTKSKELESPRTYEVKKKAQSQAGRRWSTTSGFDTESDVQRKGRQYPKS